MKRLIPGLLIPVHLLCGIVVLVTLEDLSLPAWLPVSSVVFAAFLLLNLLYVRVFKLQDELKTYWSIKKLPYFIAGAVGGLILVVIPLLLKSIAGNKVFLPGNFDLHTSLAAVIITFFTVAWEELWFRGLFLNYCRRHFSEIHLSLIMGSLFMLIHLLNPKISLLERGPALFFAGALLTLLYFYYRSIWLPLGLHFGNNFFGSFVKKDTCLFFGEDGYLSALLLAGIFFFYLHSIKKRKHERSVHAAGTRF